MITREQVADLRPGDVVEITIADYPGYVQRGPITRYGIRLYFGPYVLRSDDGVPASWARQDGYSLTVVSRAPRPLYVNSDRTEPAPGDVVRDADDDSDKLSWHALGRMFGGVTWHEPDAAYCDRKQLPARLRLLVDGTTGLPPAVTS